MAKGFACRDDKYLYLRYDFADGSPRGTELSKAIPNRLTYAARIYQAGKSEHVFMGINFDRTLFGVASNTNMHIWDVIKESATKQFRDSLSFRIGKSTLEIAVPLAPIKSYLSGGTVQVELSVINEGTHGDMISFRDTDLRTIDFGFFGSLVVTTTTEGTLYLDGRAKGDLPAGAKAKLDSVEVGDRSLEIRNADGRVERYSATVEAGSAAMVAYTYRTDFFKLAKTGTPQNVQAAIDKGADVNAWDKQYDGTAMMYAAQCNPNPEVISMLLKAGADGKENDRAGGTAFDYALNNKS